MKTVRQIYGLVWTGEGRPERRILEINGDRIAAVVPENAKPLGADALALPPTALLVPGLHDAHLHFLFGGLKLSACNFTGIRSVDEFQSVLEAFVRTHEPEPGTWVQGLGVDEARVPITRRELDRVVADRPVFIWSHDLHSAFVNTQGLAQLRTR